MKIVASTPNFPDPINPEVREKTLKTRRMVLAALTGVLLVTIAAMMMGYVPTVSVLIPVTSLLMYVVTVRRQVVAAQIKKRRLAALATITAAEVKVDPTVRIDLSSRAKSESETVLEQWVPLRERSESTTITIIEKREDKSWSPISVPRPTYATAPKAITPKRTIDLTTPGKWSAEQERQAALEIPSRDELFDQELAEQAANERDWASNQ
jgi:hypothetical protein